MTDPPEEIGELICGVLDLSEQVAATVTDEQVEERLDRLLDSQWYADLCEAMTSPISDEPCCGRGDVLHHHWGPPL